MPETPGREATDWPRISAHLPGIHGRLRGSPEDFVVEEIPAYEPADEGEHTIIWLTKRGETTTDVRRALAQLFHLREADVGFAGMKDKHAVTTQGFSLPRVAPDEAVQRIRDALPHLTVHWARRHRNKLKPGHLRGNRFRITVRDVPSNALERAQAIAAYLRRVGVPNYYGEQRFGRTGDNAAQGRAILQGKRVRDKWLRRFLLSAYQADLFNRYLARRVQTGLFTRLLLGDIAKKADTGGLFVVTEPAEEQPRYERGDIHFTGPMYGYKLWFAEGEAGALERAILEEENVRPEDFRRVRVKGTRRLGRLWVPDLQVEAPEAGLLVFTFTLPKGAFATTVLREFIREERDESEE
ncbi:MAG: tRNA pseudouridine(13) synthase TruD [Chloroflexi bacterium]|nr:tRNA pseudouridine(13) synthase TruD [Chloroflexota bacterium]